MLPIDFFFECANRLAGLDGCRTRQTARPVPARPGRIPQVGIGLGKYLAFHTSIVADLTDSKALLCKLALRNEAQQSTMP